MVSNIIHNFTITSEAATRDVFLKKVFLKFSQNSQQNTCAKATGFPLKIAKFLRTPFLQHASGRLLLWYVLFLHYSYTSNTEIVTKRVQ